MMATDAAVAHFLRPECRFDEFPALSTTLVAAPVSSLREWVPPCVVKNPTAKVQELVVAGGTIYIEI
jgi:hypothetical protein